MTEFALGPRYTFEVQTENDRRWAILMVCKNEAEATDQAEKALGTGDHDAVRIMRHAPRRKETEIWHERKVVSKKNQMLSIKTADICQTLDAVQAYPARATLGRLLRPYLDDLLLTPFGASARSVTARATEDSEVAAIPLEAYQDRVKRLQSADPVLHRVHKAMVKHLRTHQDGSVIVVS